MRTAASEDQDARQRVVIPAALVLALLLAGCTALPERAPTSVLPSILPSALPQDFAPIAFDLVSPPGTPSAPPLAVALTLSERWLKPFGTFEANVVAPADARGAWFVAHDEVEPRASVVDGEVYVLKSTTPDHHDTDGARARIAPSELAPDGRARTLRLPEAGRYQFEAAGARFMVNVWPDAPVGVSQTFLLDADAGAVRFDPPEIDAAPGARVLLWNHASRALEFRETAFAAFVPLPTEGGRVTPIDEGLYTLSALAVGADGARGLARAAFLVDFERPSGRLSAGPYTGRFVAPELGAEDPVRIGFRADHPLEELVVRFNASTTAPVPGSIEVSLLDEGDRPIASASSLTSNEIAWGELPAGGYAILVRGEHGALVSFEASIEGRYLLPTPERLLART